MNEERKKVISSLVTVALVLISLIAGAYTLWDNTFNNELHREKVLRSEGSPVLHQELEVLVIGMDLRNLTLEKEVKEHNYKSFEHIAKQDYPIYLTIMGLIILLLSIQYQVLQKL